MPRWSPQLDEGRVKKSFIAFSGDGLDMVDPLTGECTKAAVFVAVLGA